MGFLIFSYDFLIMPGNTLYKKTPLVGGVQFLPVWLVDWFLIGPEAGFKGFGFLVFRIRIFACYMKNCV